MTGLPPFMKTLGILMILVANMIPGLLFAGGKKSPTLTIRLHGEGTASDGSSFSSEIQLNNPPMKIFMRNVPVTSERDIEAFFRLWEISDFGADINLDGGVDGGDIEAFFGYWQLGC